MAIQQASLGLNPVRVLSDLHAKKRKLVDALIDFITNPPHGSFTIHSKGCIDGWEIKIIGEKESDSE